MLMSFCAQKLSIDTNKTSHQTSREKSPKISQKSLKFPNIYYIYVFFKYSLI